MAIESLDIAEFEKFAHRRKGRSISSERSYSRTMQPGTAIKLKHNGRHCNRSTGRTSCGLSGLISNARKDAQAEGRNVSFGTTHLPNGDLGVACYAVDDEVPS